MALRAAVQLEVRNCILSNTVRDNELAAADEAWRQVMQWKTGC